MQGIFADGYVLGFLGLLDSEKSVVRYWGDGKTPIDWTTWEDREQYDVILGSDVLYGTAMHVHLRPIFEANLAPGGTIFLADPFRAESFAVLEAMEADGWRVTMNKWTVGITPPERPVGVYALTR